MNATRWIFVYLFAAAVAYEVIAAAQHRGNTISEMVWDLIHFQPMWRWVIVILCLHFILGQKVYAHFTGWWK